MKTAANKRLPLAAIQPECITSMDGDLSMGVIYMQKPL
jgi:hypothetical protein